MVIYCKFYQGESIMFKGSIVALVTPMYGDGQIDYACLDQLVDFHLAEQTDGIVVLGTTGEWPTVTQAEFPEVISRVVARVNKRIPVIAGVAKNATAEAISLAQEISQLAVDGLLIVTPYYNKPTQEGLYRHYMAIAEASALPQILYNVPSRTVCDLLPATVARLTKQVPHIIGIKETVSVERVTQLVEACGNIAIYCGNDSINLPMLEAGACGLISVTANVAPRLLHDMCVAFFNGDIATAEKIHAKLGLLHENLFIEPSPTPTKWVLSKLGLIDNVLRLPLLPLSEKFHSELKRAMDAADL